MQYLVKRFHNKDHGFNDLMKYVSSVRDATEREYNTEVGEATVKAALRLNVDTMGNGPPGPGWHTLTETPKYFRYETSGGLFFGYEEFHYDEYVFFIGTPKNGGSLTSTLVAAGWLSVITPPPPPVPAPPVPVPDFEESEDGIPF